MSRRLREMKEALNQAANFADHAASGALTAVVSAEVERLWTQHADAVREKSAADSKCRKLADKVAALEGEKADLRRQLAEERREANEALAKAQAAQAEANLARVEGRGAVGGAAQRPAEPCGEGQGRDVHGGRADTQTAYGFVP